MTTHTLENELLTIWRNVLKMPATTATDNWFELGGNSLQAIAMFAEVEARFFREMPLAMLAMAPTVAELANKLRETGWDDPFASLVPIQPVGSKPPLFFMHAHGGNVFGYYDLMRELGPSQPFFGVQAQGLKTGSVAYTHMEDLAARYIDEIKKTQPHGPYYLGGFCFGGVVALEMAQQLRQRGEQTALVVLAQSWHKDYDTEETNPIKRRFHRIADRVEQEANSIAEAQGGRFGYLRGRLKRTAELGQVSAEKLLKRTSTAPSNSHFMEDLGEAHNQAFYHYTPQPYDGNVLLFRAQIQPRGVAPDSTLGWGAILPNLQVEHIHGHRIGILDQPRVRLVAERLASVLEAARQAAEPLGQEIS